MVRLDSLFEFAPREVSGAGCSSGEEEVLYWEGFWKDVP